MEKMKSIFKKPLMRMIIVVINVFQPGIKAAVQRLSWSTRRMEEYQLLRLKETISYAYLHSPFYKRYYKKAGVTPADIQTLADIEKFPIVSKTMLRAALADRSIFTEPIPPKGTIRESTTGSTGNPVELFFDRHSYHERSVNGKRALWLMGALPYKRFALIWRKKKLSLGQQLRSRLGLFKLIPVIDVLEASATALGTAELSRLVSDLISFKPQVIRGYTSALWIIAQHVKKHGLTLHPESVITSAEYLPPNWQKEMEAIFDCPVYNLYGGSEAAPIAISATDNGELIVFEDFYHIEVVNDEGKKTAPGIPGRVLVTDYANRYMPLIRYEIGDIADWSSTLPEPLPFFKEIRGRINDIFVLPEGKIVFSHNWHIYFRNLTTVAKFRVIQRTVDHIDIMLEKRFTDVVWNPELDAVRDTVYAALGEGITIKWSLVDKLDIDPGDKFRATRSEIDLDTIIKNL